MPDTPVSLLERIRLRPDAASWERLVELYRPWLSTYLRQNQLAVSDIDDLVQDVLTVVVQELPRFQHDLRKGAFRRWLRNITLNRLRVFWRSQRLSPPLPEGMQEKLLGQLEDPESDLSRRWDEEHNHHVVHRLLNLLEGDFEPRTWEAFRRVVLEGKKPAAVAGELEMTAVAVRIAKSRVLARFRQEIAGLLD